MTKNKPTAEIIIVMTALISILTIYLIFYLTTIIEDDIKEKKKHAIASTLVGLVLQYVEAEGPLMAVATDTISQQTPSTHLVSQELHGVPLDIEIEKRELARQTINIWNDFRGMYYVLPNGDVYLYEDGVETNGDYDYQLDLPFSNVADKEWYKEAMQTLKEYKTTDTFSSEYLRDNATIIEIAHPVYSEESDELVGFWVAEWDMELSFFEASPGPQPYTAYILYSNNGDVIADIAWDRTSEDLLTMIANSEPIRKAMGENLTGNFEEDIKTAITEVNGTRAILAYTSHFGSNDWTLVSYEPYDTAFRVVEHVRQISILASLAIISLAGIMGYLLQKMNVVSPMPSLKQAYGIAGILAAAITIIGIPASAIKDTQFDWGSALSDLGGSNGYPATLFDYTLIIAGAIAVIFAAGLFREIPNKIGFVGASFLIIASAFLIGIGIFPYSHDLHGIVSFGYFLFLPMSLILIGIGLRKQRCYSMANITLIAGLITATCHILLLTPIVAYTSLAMLEFIGALSAVIWVIIFSIKLIRQHNIVNQFIKK